MRHAHVALTAAAFFGGVCHAGTVIEGRIDSVALFKNGLAVITRIIEVPEPGVYVLESVPTAVHGTFWLESDALLTTTTRVRNVEVPLDVWAGANLREELMGREVTVRLREPKAMAYSGRVIRLEPLPSDQQWSRRYEASPYGWWQPTGGARLQTRTAGPLILDDGDQRHYISPDIIAAVTVHDPQPTVVRRKPVLEIRIDAPDTGDVGPFVVTMTYLAKGITWAPAYLASLDGDGRLVLRQQTSIRNELEEIEDADVYLISGFPNIQFSHVDSLASPAATIAGFFTQLNQRVGGRHAARREVMSQALARVDGSDVELDLEGLAGESSDIHYQFAGRRSLPLGAASSFTVAQGEARYERIVEWTIPDQRDSYGRLRSDAAYAHQHNPEDDGAWDAVRFRNPLPFPLTTAPIMVMDGDRFAGQRTVYWTNPNDRCTVPVTKALSIHVSHGEFEEAETRRSASRFNRNGNLVTVRGEVELYNHRAAPIEMVVRRPFSGDLIEADESPRVRLLTEGIRAFNPRHELTWTLPLQPGEKRTLTYRYDVFVVR
jgi:hypothetical protein